MEVYRLSANICIYFLVEILSVSVVLGDEQSTELRNLSFPKNFIFGAGSAAYQIEGAWNEDGKGENIWDRLSHSQPELMKNGNGDIACDSYHKYKEDISLLKNIGFDAYRLSVSWARILPTGDITNISYAGIKYYVNVINELVDNGIEPMVTMYHWDMPQKLQDIGGWMNPLIVDYFVDYAGLLFKHLGDKVKWWITINEPMTIVLTYTGISMAPNLKLGTSVNYIVGHNILKAHGRVFRLYERKYKVTQQGKMSICLNGPYIKPKTNSDSDIEASKLAMIFLFGWFAHPIYSREGDYPKIMRDIIDEKSKKEGRNRSRLPTFSKDEIESIRGSYDYFGINHYNTKLGTMWNGTDTTNIWGVQKDANVQFIENDPSWPTSFAFWQTIYPEGLRQLFVWIKEQYNDVPIFVLENGYADEGGIDDFQRLSYHKACLIEVLRAIKLRKCNVIGYLAWSLLDNLEWNAGFKHKFGLVQVNFTDPTLRRTLKKSAFFFRDFLQSRTLSTN